MYLGKAKEVGPVRRFVFVTLVCFLRACIETLHLSVLCRLETGLAVCSRAFWADESSASSESFFTSLSLKLSSSLWLCCQVFSKIRATFGGRLKTLCMGSAPMKPEAIVTLQLLLAAPVCEVSRRPVVFGEPRGHFVERSERKTGNKGNEKEMEISEYHQPKHPDRWKSDVQC